MSLSDVSLAGEVPGLDGLSEDLEQALRQVRRATEELPPLEELAGLQETMAGLSQVGSVVGRMQSAAEQEAEALRRMVGLPDWRMEARVRVSREGFPTAILELRADFDLGRLIQDRATDGEVIARETLSPSALAVMREFKVQRTSRSGSTEEVEGPPAAASIPYIPLELSADGGVCLALAPVVARAVSLGDLASSSWLEDVSLQTTLRPVRVPLSRFQQRNPFRRSRESRYPGLELSLRLSFRPLGGLDAPL